MSEHPEIVGCGCESCTRKFAARVSGRDRDSIRPNVKRGQFEQYQRDVIKRLQDAGFTTAVPVTTEVFRRDQRREAYDQLRKHLTGMSSTTVIKDEYDERAVVATVIAACALWRPIQFCPQDTFVFLKRFERVTFGKYDTRNEPKLGYTPCWLSWDGGFTRRQPPTHFAPVPVILQDWHALAGHVRLFGLPCAH